MTTASIQDGWTLSRMRELGAFSGGSTPQTSDPTLWGGDIKWLVPSEISGLQEYQTHIYETTNHLTQKGFESCSTKLLPPGTVAVSSRATVGDCIILGSEICTNQGFVNIISNERVNNLFLLYWLRHNRRELLRYAAGTTGRTTPRSMLKIIAAMNHSSFIFFFKPFTWKSTWPARAFQHLTVMTFIGSGSQFRDQPLSKRR